MLKKIDFRVFSIANQILGINSLDAMATTPPAQKNEKTIDDNINAATIPDQSSSEEYIYLIKLHEIE